MGWTCAAPRWARRGMITDTAVKNQPDEFRTRRLCVAVRCVALCFWIIVIPSTCLATMSVFWSLLLLRFSLCQWIIWQKTVRQRRFMLIHLNNSNVWPLNCLKHFHFAKYFVHQQCGDKNPDSFGLNNETIDWASKYHNLVYYCTSACTGNLDRWI